MSEYVFPLVLIIAVIQLAIFIELASLKQKLATIRTEIGQLQLIMGLRRK